jgi:hypothetical protein
MNNDKTFAVLSLVVLAGVVTAFMSVRTPATTTAPGAVVQTVSTTPAANTGS